mmetsp:Transcript_2835/g.4106  ORF Transcript_2835/g.4106 Transcript_2835/m.4106 type:complete len:82 (+) Transcript_2835:1338-1583(+)
MGGLCVVVAVVVDYEIILGVKEEKQGIAVATAAATAVVQLSVPNFPFRVDVDCYRRQHQHHLHHRIIEEEMDAMRKSPPST